MRVAQPQPNSPIVPGAVVINSCHGVCSHYARQGCSPLLPRLPDLLIQTDLSASQRAGSITKQALCLAHAGDAKLLAYGQGEDGSVWAGQELDQWDSAGTLPGNPSWLDPV